MRKFRNVSVDIILKMCDFAKVCYWVLLDKLVLLEGFSNTEVRVRSRSSILFVNSIEKLVLTEKHLVITIIVKLSGNCGLY